MKRHLQRIIFTHQLDTFYHISPWDGTAGVTAGAPYDVVISAAASESISKDWLRQMAVGGRLVAPVKAPDSDVQTLHVVDRVSPDEWSLTVLDPVRFVPLRAGVAR